MRHKEIGRIGNAAVCRIKYQPLNRVGRVIRSFSKDLAVVISCLFAAVGHAQDKPDALKSYHTIITPEFVTKNGFLGAHVNKNRIYLEIPSAMLGVDMLFIEHHYYSGATKVRWVKRDDSIHLIIPELESRVGNRVPVVDKSIKGDMYDLEMTVATLPILAMSIKDSGYVVDATDLFLQTPEPLSGRGKVLRKDLAFINKVMAFDNTIEVQTRKTYATEKGPITAESDFSLFLLPEPMMPRLFDHRMGFFPDVSDLSQTVMRAATLRWRLEKKHPDQKLSEPVKPIVYYLDPAIPEKWRPYVRAGVEEWLPAFEAAGFRNAIVVKDPPVGDEHWSMNSMRYSYVRWINRSAYRGKEGDGAGTVDTIADRRTGELLKVDILIGRINGIVDRYFARCSPLDTRAQQYPFPDELLGRLIQYLTAHETGHSFGLKDGNYGSFGYPFEKLRDRSWLQEMGHTPSVMNYARDNIVVQPEDGIPPSLLVQKVGPADLYSIRWGYTQFDNIKAPEDELPHLEKIVREQDSVPWYKYTAHMGVTSGPDRQMEVVDSDNPVKVAELAARNLRRTIKLIPVATRHEQGSDTAQRFYEATLNLWVDYMTSVASMVGGYITQFKNTNTSDPVYDYSAIPAASQREAVRFLIDEAFGTPLWMAAPEITRDYESQGTLDNVSSRQLKVLSELLSRGRLMNMEETDLAGREGDYRMTDLFDDLHAGLWSELESIAISINPYRQQLQLAHILMLINYLSLDSDKRFLDASRTHSAKMPFSLNGYTRANVLTALSNIKDDVEKVLPKVTDATTRSHLQLCLLEMEKIWRIA